MPELTDDQWRDKVVNSVDVLRKEYGANTPQQLRVAVIEDILTKLATLEARVAALEAIK